MQEHLSSDRVYPGRRPAATCILMNIAGILYIVAGLGGAMAQELGQLEHTLQEAGYQLYYPPRANWGPGFVFEGDIVNGKIKIVNEICTNLYAAIGSPQPSDTPILLADYHASDDFSFQLSINFLKGLLGDSLNLRLIVGKRTVDVKWLNVREKSSRPIEKRCRSAIEDLKAKGRFKDRVFVIVRAVAPEVLVYNFSRAAAVDAGGSAEFSEQLKAAAQGKGEIKNATQLEIKQPIFIGYAPPVKIDEWLPTGLVSGEIVEVRGQARTFFWSRQGNVLARCAHCFSSNFRCMGSLEFSKCAALYR
jgi:hypothetical protein